MERNDDPKFYLENKFTMRRPIGFLTIALIVFATASGGAQLPRENGASRMRSLRLDDLFNLESILGSEVASDGAVAIVRGTAQNTVTNALIGTVTDIWIQERPGAPLANITNGATDSSQWSNPIWSGDGRHLLMRSTRGGAGTTLWMWARESRTLRQVTPRMLTTDHSFGWAGDRVLCAVVTGAAGVPDSRYAGERDAWRRMEDGWHNRSWPVGS